MAVTGAAILTSGLLVALNTQFGNEESCTVFDKIKEKLESLNYNAKHSRSLLSECKYIVNSLQHIPHRRLNSERAHYLIDKIDDCINWCDKYDKKTLTSKILFKTYHKKELLQLHNELFRNYLLLVMDLLVMLVYDKQKDTTSSERSGLYTPKTENFYSRKDSPLNVCYVETRDTIAIDSHEAIPANELELPKIYEDLIHCAC